MALWPERFGLHKPEILAGRITSVLAQLAGITPDGCLLLIVGQSFVALLIRIVVIFLVEPGLRFPVAKIVAHVAILRRAVRHERCILYGIPIGFLELRRLGRIT